MFKAIVFGVMLLLGGASVGFAQECLHGRNETSENRQRRERAIQVAHRINAAQAAAIAVNPRASYKRLSEMKLPEVPNGFQLTLHVNGRTTYALSLRDVSDPCSFAIWSDQDRFVYAAHPERDTVITIPVQPR